MTDEHIPPRQPGLFALTFALVFPSIVTWAYFVLLADQPSGLQIGAYFTGKTIQFVFPVVWVFFVLREKFAWPASNTRGLATGLAFGLAVLVLMLLLYHFALKQTGLFDMPAEIVKAKLHGMMVRSGPVYAGLGVFYALIHSGAEEYYWRWFVFAQLRKRTSFAAAAGLSSVAFMAHHIILLAAYFGWTSPAGYLFSLGVAVGGVVWCWIYEKSGSILGPWLSHCLIDAGIFLIGYDLVFAG